MNSPALVIYENVGRPAKVSYISDPIRLEENASWHASLFAAGTSLLRP